MNHNKKKPVFKPGIRWKLFLYMLFFLILLLGLLWTFQVAFFGDIYKSVRMREIKGSTEDICDNIDFTDTQLKELGANISDKKQVCTLIFDENGNIISSSHVQTDCVIHTMPPRNIYMLYDFAVREGGDKLSRFKLGGFQNMSPEDNFRIPGIINHGNDDKETEDNSAESIIFTKVAYSEERGKDVIVMLNATVSPVVSTVRTLRTELIIITSLMVIIAILLSFLMARRISRPIVKINESAKELAKGNYNADFSENGYREIAELSGTLSYAAKELSKTEVLQRELIANISHDLRTPLTMITGYAEMMRDIPGENTPENVQIIIDEASRLTNLVKDVLDISRLQSGTGKLQLSEFNITETVREVISRFSKLTEQEGYTVSFEYDCNVVVNADRSQILQVIYNYINNAITHSGKDKNILVTQKVIVTEKEKRVRIEVKDNGVGIPPEHAQNIWDRYYKVGKPQNRANVSSGLGLSIAKGILELHGAKYGVISEVGKGSTFYFEL